MEIVKRIDTEFKTNIVSLRIQQDVEGNIMGTISPYDSQELTLTSFELADLKEILNSEEFNRIIKGV